MDQSFVTRANQLLVANFMLKFVLIGFIAIFIMLQEDCVTDIIDRQHKIGDSVNVLMKKIIGSLIQEDLSVWKNE